MGSVAIKIENVSKLYRLGEVGTGSFAHDLNRWWQTRIRGKSDPYLAVGSKNDRTQNARKGEHVWALNDINLEVNQGEVIGVIGKNGAGKSTLLKLLSRVTAPTAGKIRIRGRIASLLEVGTGFHPEMTGRENIFMNGTIMGMNRHEIRAKLDEIVEFAGVAKYLDTPTKRYSSGMTVRLGFAVAAFLEPEILIVDEVLAVGDAEFQRKAVAKMMESSSAGKTILIVSHNMSTIRSLSNKGVLLDQGSVASVGDIDTIVSKYLGATLSDIQTYVDLKEFPRGQHAQELIFSSLLLKENPVEKGSPIEFNISLEKKNNRKEFRELDFGIAINDRFQNCIYHVSNRFISKSFIHRDDSKDKYLFRIENKLKPGDYTVTLFVRSEDVIQDVLKNAFKLCISDYNPYSFHNSGLIQGAVMPQFEIEKV